MLRYWDALHLHIRDETSQQQIFIPLILSGMGSADETTELAEDFHKTPGNSGEEEEELDINEAIERAGGGIGLVLYSVGPFLLFCLEGAEIVVLSIIAVILRCEWDLSTTSIAALQVCFFVIILPYNNIWSLVLCNSTRL